MVTTERTSPTLTAPHASTCTSCGDRLIGLDWYRDVCAWCQPEDTALCPGCYGSGTAYRNAADMDGDDCPVCWGSGRITTRVGAAQLRGRVA